MEFETVLAGTLKIGDEFRILEPRAMNHSRVREKGESRIIADCLAFPGESVTVDNAYPVQIEKGKV